jgi:hypothetical protein
MPARNIAFHTGRPPEKTQISPLFSPQEKLFALIAGTCQPKQRDRKIGWDESYGRPTCDGIATISKLA